MAVNLYDAARELEKVIRQSDEYKQLTQAYAEVNADEAAKRMFDSFRKMQMNLQQKQMMGQDITQAEVEQAQKTVALVQQNPKISHLMQAEQRMSTVIGELNQLIMKPLEELYGTPQY
ncbi:YlbF family regulator [Bacillus sp. EB600]|uniref:YlbF family regulator n=1 Tax=Bacillus sp. EB600 TaxID=2806345 RepID=UPI002108E2DB|nr:YlbF family regulator [Bacillus sp. EB600]MCQ6280680.1 YlbF family regulator [Bacillus sp. EB600]